MKTKLFLAVILFVAAGCDPVLKEAEVPAIVREAFSAKYPAATQVEWERENKRQYEVEFVINGNKREALFNNDGSFAKEEKAS